MSEIPILVRHDQAERGHGQVPLLQFTTHDRPLDPEESDPHAAWDDMVARAIGRVLHGHYRGHFWNVWVSRKAGIAKIWIATLMNPMYPYVLKLHEGVQPHDVIRAGGEILERYRIPRSAIDLPAFMAAKKKAGPLSDRMAPPE